MEGRQGEEERKEEGRDRMWETGGGEGKRRERRRERQGEGEEEPGRNYLLARQWPS